MKPGTNHETHSLIIKNMVCDRCIHSTIEILSRLKIPYSQVNLGEVELPAAITSEKLKDLKLELSNVGFELILGKSEIMVNRIKGIIINSIYEDNLKSKKNLSAILSEELHYDYSHLSSIFSAIEGCSIQSFQHKIRTERVKELLEYDEISITEIADSLGYGSAAYLSTSFKKATGLSPSVYRLKNLKTRKPLDSV